MKWQVEQNPGLEVTSRVIDPRMTRTIIVIVKARISFFHPFPQISLWRETIFLFVNFSILKIDLNGNNKNFIFSPLLILNKKIFKKIIALKKKM